MTTGGPHGLDANHRRPPRPAPEDHRPQPPPTPVGGGGHLHRPPGSDAPVGQLRRPLCVPACARATRQTAARDLHLAVSLVLWDPRAARAVQRLAAETEAEPEGALVFGCLLFLADYEEAAQFWWRYAAGGDSPTAAFCLYLLHRHRAEHRDARLWRQRYAALQQSPRRHAPARRDSRPLLPAAAREALLVQCRDGRYPHLPPTVEAAVNSLYGRQHTRWESAEGAFPLPDAQFPDQLRKVGS